MNRPQPRTAAIAKPIRMGRVSPRVRLIAMEVPAVLLLRDKGPIKAWFRPGPPKDIWRVLSGVARSATQRRGDPRLGRLSVGPFAQGGLDEALGLAVCLGRIRLGSDLLEAEIAAGAAEGLRASRSHCRSSHGRS